MRRVGWTVLSVSLLALSIWLSNSGSIAGAVAAGIVGFAGGWTFATRVLP